MHSSVCNAKDFYYIAPVIKNEIGKINVVCEGLLFLKHMMLIHLFWIHCSMYVFLGINIEFLRYF